MQIPRIFIDLKWRYAFISSILFVSTFLFSQFFTSNLGNILEQKKLQKSVISICSQMDEIEKSIIDKDENYNFFNDTLLQSLNDKGINAFVYKNDSLVAWSDNDYILESNITNKKVSIEHIENAYVLVKNYSLTNFSLKLSFPIKASYKIENEYLKNELNSKLGIIKQLKFVEKDNNAQKIFSPNGEILIYNKWLTEIDLSSKRLSLLFLLYILGFSFFLQFLRKLILSYSLSKVIRTTLFIFLLAISTYVFNWLLVPDLLLKSDIFSPTTFASSKLFASLGSLFILTISSLFLIIGLSDYIIKITNKKAERPSLFILYTSLLGLLLLIKSIVADLVFNSTISFDITQLSSINYLSIIGLIAIGILIFIYLFILRKGLQIIPKDNNIGSWISLSTISTAVFFTSIINGNHSYILILFFIFTVGLQLLFEKENLIKSATLSTLYLLAFSLILSIWLNNFNSENEHNKRKSIIQNIAINQDPKVEYLFTEISKKIYKDKELIEKFQNNNIEFDSISAYIENNYFRAYKHFDKYDFQTTVCTKDLKLIIRPQNVEILCDTFFYENLIQYGTLTSDKNLYLLNYGTGQVNYLGLFRFFKMTEDGYLAFTVYIEINSKLKRKGFTKLLSAGEYDPFEKIANYSLATYENGRRIENYGNYGYPEHFSWDIKGGNDLVFYKYQNYSHLIFQTENNKIYILSRKIPPTFSKVAPFSYLLIIYSLLFLILTYFSNSSVLKSKLKLSFASRLQIAMISIIFISFAIISSITLYYINKLDEDKNSRRLQDLAIALQTEFEHKLSGEDDLSKVDPEYLNSLLMKFSKVFDTDINIYHLDGRLLSSTRYEVFQYPLLSELMNPKAFNYLKKEHQNLYIAKENIGSLVYSSAYLPFHNSMGQNIAFINLPYFARQEVLRQEVSNLLMTLMNVYALIIVISILVILFVSNYVSRPLAILKKHMQEVGLGKKNQKIEWKGIEEINALVDEYNIMIDALEISSNKLAKSERESAWREMAKQVAHEIKNPLTPMKLSVQYMMRAYGENTEDQKERIQSLSNTLIEQIDTLADIATAFSNFADMPKSSMDRQEINSVIRTATELYNERENVSIILDCKKQFYLNIDKSQWIRVFNNLIKNSIQAANDSGNIEIRISIEQKADKLIIQFQDNGKGIPIEMQAMIFTPKFTTKTQGAGLGLAMVKSIVSNSNGDIWLKISNENGSVFVIEMPIK